MTLMLIIEWISYGKMMPLRRKLVNLKIIRHLKIRKR